MKRLVVGNMKMNILSSIERDRYLGALKKEINGKKFEKTEIILCPSSVHIESFKKSVGKKISIGAQNMFWEREGSFTGEISPAMIKNLGCEYVILGHSERRRYFSEKDEEINLKIHSALKIGLKPIICVGETKLEKQTGQTLRVVTNQVKKSISGINRVKAESIIIAYEPVWAVGSDMVPTPNEIMEAKLLIRKILVGLFEKKHAQLVRILYGGSVSSKTAEEVCIEPAMDGVLIGRESLVPYELIKIAEIINR
jgi:triosephosphate isomerase (TIM)